MEELMRSIQYGDKHFIRVDKGEEIVNILTEFCMKRSINLGKISAIGAASEVEIGVFDTVNKEYNSKIMKGIFEILLISGNISTSNYKPYLHLHITLSDSNYNTFGGHLNRAIVSATCEIIVEVYKGKLDRYFDESIGLNLFEL
jgi:hypothetical protein